MFDFYSNEAAGALAQAARQPAATLETSPAESFSLARQAADRFGNVLASQRNTADAAQDWLDDFERKTGERLQNPYALGYNPMGWNITEALGQLDTVRKRAAAKAAELGDDTLNFPDDAVLFGRGVQKAREALGAQARAAQGQQPFGTGIGTALGGLVSQVDDPTNLALNAVALAGAPTGGTLLRGIIGTGAMFGAQTLAEDVATYGYRQAVNPEFGPDDVAHDMAAAAIGGMALDAGGKAVAALFRRLRTTNPAVVDRMPLEARDAGIVGERVADIDAQSPFRGVAGQTAHDEAIISVERDLLAGRPPELPGATLAEASAPTGDVFAPSRPSPLEIVDRHAYASNPELFERVNRADQDIVQAKQRLSELQQPSAGDSTFGSLATRIDDLQGQLDAITGKRRSSPRAKALRQQIEDLTAQSASLDADAAARAGDLADTLRSRLVEAQNERARLGPEVRAARESAAKELGIPLDADARLDTAPSHSGNLQVSREPFAQEPVAAPVAESSQPAKGVRSKTRKGGAPTSGQDTDAAAPSAPIPPATPDITAPRLTTGPAAEASTYAGTRAVRVKYEVAERSNLVTSHDLDGAVNAAYPPDLQPRNRAGVPQRDQVHAMAADLVPERLGPSADANAGPPIVGADNIVESGNGRTLAIGLAYRQAGERASAYRAFLERRGFDTTGLREPVLIARRLSPMSDAERTAFAHAANGSQALRMSATEQAVSDARHIAPDIADRLRPGDIRSRDNRDFVRAFIDRLPAGERGGMMTADGQLSASGVNRVRAALVARAYGDAEIVARAFDHAEPNIKTLASALTEAAPEWIRMRDAVRAGEIPAGVDITDDMITAVRAIMRARDEGRTVGEIMHQGDFFASDTSALAARLFFKDGSLSRFLSKADMGENLSSFARGILETRGRGDDLFGQPAPATKDVLNATVRRSDQRVVSMMEAARRPEAIAKAAADPKVQEAAEADLHRAILQEKRVPVEGPDNTVRLGNPEEELKALDQQLHLANEVRGCTTIMDAAE